MEMDKYTEDLELVIKNDKFALYINRNTNEISVLSYSDDDLCTMTLTGLGKQLF